jgi:pimeloyl-ACP methyl ester carboxylesterase
MQGGWYWEKVRPLLESKDRQILTPCLSGLGSCAHLHHVDINLSTHIQDIVNIIDQDPDKKVTLIAHSYGGMVATGAGVLRPNAVRQIIYLDAVLGESGQSMATAIEPEIWMSIAKKQQDWQIPAMTIEDFGLQSPQDQDFVKNRSSPQSIACFTEALHYNEEVHTHIPSLYVKCLKAPFLLNMKQRAQKLGISYEEIQTSHFPMVEVPEFLSAYLIDKLH